MHRFLKASLKQTIRIEKGFLRLHVSRSSRDNENARFRYPFPDCSTIACLKIHPFRRKMLVRWTILPLHRSIPPLCRLIDHVGERRTNTKSLSQRIIPYRRALSIWIKYRVSRLGIMAAAVSRLKSAACLLSHSISRIIVMRSPMFIARCVQSPLVHRRDAIKGLLNELAAPSVGSGRDAKR